MGKVLLLKGRKTATTFDEKIEGYLEVLDKRLYRTFLSDPTKPMAIKLSSGSLVPDDYFAIHTPSDAPPFRKRPRILTVTTNATHGINLDGHTQAKNHPRRDSFVFVSVPYFGREWSLPREPLAVLPT